MTSRGCSSRCSFCSARGLWGTFRGLSPAKVLEELELLKLKYGVQEVQFIDDNLTADKVRARAIFQGMIDRKLDLAWSAPNGVALHTLDEDLVRLMRQSGCYRLVLPIESGSARVLTRIMRKPLQIEKVPAQVDFIRKQGIGIDAYFVVGMPGETLQEIKMTFDLAFCLGIFRSHFSFVMPIPGTPVYEQFLDYLRVTDPQALERLSEIEREFDYKVPSIGSSAWTIEELQKFVSRMMVRMYLKFMLLKPGIFFTEITRMFIDHPMVLWELLKFFARALTRVPTVIPGRSQGRRRP
jgi:magnesium-protoporphyrin IX monomethyl ester (oxidative) cyclase